MSFISEKNHFRVSKTFCRFQIVFSDGDSSGPSQISGIRRRICRRRSQDGRFQEDTSIKRDHGDKKFIFKDLD